MKLISREYSLTDAASELLFDRYDVLILRHRPTIPPTLTSPLVVNTQLMVQKAKRLKVRLALHRNPIFRTAGRHLPSHSHPTEMNAPALTQPDKPVLDLDLPIYFGSGIEY